MPKASTLASTSPDTVTALRDVLGVQDVLGTVNIYADTAAGIAATVDGEYFSVPSAEDDEYLVLYKNESEVATEVKTYPAKGALDVLLRGDGVKKLKVVSGVIRNTGAGWDLIEDSGHASLNVGSVSSNTTGVTIAYSFTASKVISFVAGPDERMAQAGMTVGGSVSVTGAGLWIGAPLTFWIDPLTGAKDVPAWFDPASVSVSGSGATRTITHPEVSEAAIAPVIGQGYSSSLVGAEVGTSTLTTTTFGIQSLTDLAGLVYYNGSAWVISTDVDTTVHTISAAWEASNGGQLRVTHPTCENSHAVSADSTADGYSIIINGAATGSFTVKFFDSSGVQVASPVSPIGIRFMRPKKCRTAAVQSCRLNVSRGTARLDPTLLNDTTMPLANIWFVGVFEVA